MTLPDYINCKSKTIMHCDYLLHEDCESTCAYALDIGGIGVGAPVIPIRRQSKKGIDDEVQNE